MISKEDVILALRSGVAKQGSAAKHAPVAAAVAVPAVKAAHPVAVAAVAGEFRVYGDICP